MHAQELWESPGLGPRLARAALTPLSWLYAAGWSAYLAVYALGLKRAETPAIPVVCVGNLLVGGSGKTPLTLHVADVLASLGREVVLGMSGYGSPRAEAATLAPSGPLDPAEWGDEPALARLSRPDLPIVVGRRRVLAARLAAGAYPNAVLLMDDGLQHLPLRKTVSILVDPEDPPNPRCLPAGPYREPRRRRTKFDLTLPNSEFRITNSVSPGLPPGVPYALLTAVGQPAKVAASLAEALGLPPDPIIALPDHDPLTPASLPPGTLAGRVPPGRPILVTAKDGVKLARRSDLGDHRFVVVGHSVRVEPEDAFRARLRDLLDGRRP